MLDGVRIIVLAGGFPIKEDNKAAEVITAYIVVSIIAIPMTCWLAIKFGQLGQRLQGETLEQGQTLGVADWHWAWMWLSLVLYGHWIVINIMAFISMQSKMWVARNTFGSLLSLLGLAVVVVWITPLVVSYQTLTGKVFEGRTAAQRGALVAAILVGGYFVATMITHAFAWILGKFGF